MSMSQNIARITEREAEHSLCAAVEFASLTINWHKYMNDAAALERWQNIKKELLVVLKLMANDED